MAEPFAKDLLQSVPEFKPDFDEHVRFHGELLVHILLGELFDYAQRTYTEVGDPGERADAADILKRVFNFIERQVLSEDADISTAIVVSFLNLLRSDEPDVSVSDHRLRTILKNVRVEGRERPTKATTSSSYAYFRELLGPNSLREWKNYTGYE